MSRRCLFTAMNNYPLHAIRWSIVWTRRTNEWMTFNGVYQPLYSFLDTFSARIEENVLILSQCLDYFIVIYPFKAEIGIVRQSRRPINTPESWKTGLISRTPITSGRSCLLANINNGTPDSSSFLIILSTNKSCVK